MQCQGNANYCQASGTRPRLLSRIGISGLASLQGIKSPLSSSRCMRSWIEVVHQPQSDFSSVMLTIISRPSGLTVALSYSVTSPGMFARGINWWGGAT